MLFLQSEKANSQVVNPQLVNVCFAVPGDISEEVNSAFVPVLFNIEKTQLGRSGLSCVIRNRVERSPFSQMVSEGLIGCV
jgi:hypothetical protein